ncbi:J domain-containing protein [Leptospira sp. 96542]|nr:J domain-containing protein [Leptospira sp. 96542]
MNPFDLLGVSRDADATTIKRAYARLLKTTRPDENPQGFQRLNEAYQAALAWHERDPALLLSAQQEELQVPHKTTTPTETSTSATEGARDAKHPLQETATPQPEPFSLDKFLQAVEEEAQTSTPEQLTAWLQQQPAFYELNLKTSVATALHDALFHNALEPLSEPQLQSVVKFFGFEVPLLASQRRGVYWAIAREKTSHYGEPLTAVIRQIKYEHPWWRNILEAVFLYRSLRITRLGNALYGYYGGWPEMLNYAQFMFHARLANPSYLGRWRWAQIGLRALAVTLVFSLFSFLSSASFRTASSVASYTLLYALIFFAFITGLLWWQVQWKSYARRLPKHWKKYIFLLPLCFGIADIALSQIFGPHWPTTPYWQAILLIATLTTMPYLRPPWLFTRFFIGGMSISVFLFVIDRNATINYLTFVLVPFVLPAICIATLNAAYAYKNDISIEEAALGNPWAEWTSYALACFAVPAWIAILLVARASAIFS